MKVAVRTSPVPEIAPRVPPETVTSPAEPSQLKLAPGSSLKVKVMVAVPPARRVLTLLVIASVGAVGSIVRFRPELAEETLPAASSALAVRVWEPALSVEVVIDQFPAPSAVDYPT